MNPPPPGPPEKPRPAAHPFAFTVLVVPFGATFGFVSVALAFLATQRGLTVQQGAELIAAGMFPNVVKLLWAPIADTTLTRKHWYVLGCVLSAAGMFAMAAVPLGPATLRLMEVIIFVTSVASTFLGFAVEAMMAHLTPPADRGRVSGWFQAGNLGGNGIGGGVGLWLLTNLPAGWMAGLILGVLTLACAAALPLLPEVVAEPRSASVVGTVHNVLADFWQAISSRDGVLSAVLCFVPVGTGAASGVLAQAEVAAHWNAGVHAVELVQGFLTGIISMVGCVVGGYGCKRLGSRTAYVVYGGIMAAVTAAMAVLPASPLVYVAGGLTYSFITGFCFAAFSAFVLDAIGTGNAATKYNGFASISNTPIWYMGLLLAAVETRLGARGMLYAESLCGLLGILAFSAAAAAWRRRAPAEPASLRSEATTPG